MATPDKPLEQMTAQERLDFGRFLYKHGKFDDAIAVLKTIAPTEDSPTYAEAQFGLGLTYESKGNFDKAINTWKNIRRDDNPKFYAGAQYHLGAAYKEQGKLNQSIKVWSNITRDDRPEAYALAQFSLGLAHHSKNEMNKAIAAWSQIRRDDDPETYAKAQLGLGKTYYEKNPENPDEAIEVWSKIRRNDDPETYAKAQLGLGEVYSQDKEKKEQAREAYNNVREFSYYKSERGFKVIDCPQELINNLYTLAKSTDEVLKSLQIIPDFEPTVAHYSRALTAFNLFGDEKNNKNPSNFRLSTIRGVNDPTEGQVLGKYWGQQGIPETIHTNDTATFVSCFTFNHDSLNQFRLYGKENGREATGVSLVFKKEFFSDQSDTLEFIADPSIDSSNKAEKNKSDEADKPESDNKKRLIDRSTLYRCIYLDPETGYWTLAQRDKSTFYREHNEDGDTQEKWDKYYDELIPEKEENVEKYLFDKEDNNNKSVSSILKLIFTEPRSYDKEEKQKILEAVRFILLPLQYLVKHIAFQEEQECRIMYITHLHDEKIRHNWEKQQVYVEYEEPALPHIDEIYLSPGAAKYQDFFRILLDQKEDGKESKVRISQNPFRNKE